MYTSCHCDNLGHDESFAHSGQPETFTLNVRPARNFPIDLYLLMDLSFSMRDDLDNLKRLGSDLGMLMAGLGVGHGCGWG